MIEINNYLKINYKNEKTSFKTIKMINKNINVNIITQDKKLKKKIILKSSLKI